MGWTYYLIKVGMFLAFVAVIYFAISSVMTAVSKVLNLFALGTNVLYILSKFHICEAVNVFLSAYIAGWIINKLINYWM